MFSILKIFILFLNIILSTCAPIVFFDQWGNELPISGTKTYDQLTKEQLIAILQSKEAELKNEVKENGKLIGKLEEKVNNYEKVLRIIGARTKLEGLVDKLYPLRKNSKTGEMIYGKPDSSYCDALNEMLQSNDIRFTADPFVSMLRQRLIDNGISVSIFMKFSRWLYNQFSDKACHKMAQFSPPLPHYDDIDAIKEMLQCVEIDADLPAALCLKIMLQPLDLP